MTVSIIGAGMAGLLAGAMFRQEAQIYEAAASLPNNHHALLRFRSDDIAQHLNIEFSSVEVMKIVKPWRNKVAEAIGYSMKSNGRASLRSIRSAEGKIDKRFVAPPDFIQQLECQWAR
jgi:2-polyprenyl-6-methoxyphenol hydroxylase-like FAD-dependent oxidoreductase